ncbi:GNAT family N-acetyltransferase [Clostridiaceae bacterium M8S5]|nr:GNAT family N-acetyltransferase [Clostridiaceae bacterium M8S5]
MLKLKKTTKDDIKILVNIKRNAFAKEFEKYGFIPEEMISIEWHEHMITKSIYYVIENDKKIIGGVNIFKEKDKCYLCSLFLDGKLQNKGFGTDVIKLLENIHADVHKWNLETPSMSKQNHYFYEKCGYKHINDITPKGAPKGFSLRVYEKIINN